MINTIFSRISTRDFSPQVVSKEDLNKILLAGMAAPVGRSRYDSLHLTTITNNDLLNEISTAEDYSSSRPRAPLYGAKTLILVSSKIEGDSAIEYSNVGCVIQTMAIAARSLGIASIYLWSCIESLKKHPDIVKKLDLPNDFIPVSALGIGYSTFPLEKHVAPRHAITLNKIS